MQFYFNSYLYRKKKDKSRKKEKKYRFCLKGKISLKSFSKNRNTLYVSKKFNIS